jgi:hypothetical protein
MMSINPSAPILYLALSSSNTWYTGQDENHRIRYSSLGSIEIKSKTGEQLLCLADCVANASRLAFNQDQLWADTNTFVLDQISKNI